MIQMTGNELRSKFLQFFAGKDHLVLKSYPLIPENDPTLLLIGAGMAPFKPFFTGKLKPPHLRITTSQKCVRTGDIENVGRTARHHTFFEMLGNFSFGDYFKKEAIAWAWEFLTEWLEMPKEKLWITIHPDDDEAYHIWRNDIGVPHDHIVKLEDNFWEIGPGPCGPCSEIYIDLGEQRGCGRPDCAVGCDCDRFLEIWNLVFTQYDRDEAGNYKPLAKKNIDTGAGLERIASVLQDKKSNFETDLLYPIIEYTCRSAGISYGQNPATDISLKVIADHARSIAFMISDGILPSNEGRGYVLRRVLRRAVRHGRLLGLNKLFLYETIDTVVQMFAEPYPDLAEKQDYIKNIIRIEEERFQATLAQGMELLNQHINGLSNAGKKVLDGVTAFKLYDTYGFPWELTQEIISEHGIELDKDAFDQAMNEQRERARAARHEKDERIAIPDMSGLVIDQLAHDLNATSGKVTLMWQDGKIVNEVHDGQEAAIILTATPFYAEGGGQVGDTGFFKSPVCTVEVETARKLPNGAIYHMGRVMEGTLRTGDVVEFEVDTLRKRDIAKNHTGTHLLQSALRKVLGEHVNQAGSAVGPDRLRFDFSHFSAVTPEQLAEVESIVNEVIIKNIPVSIIETTQDLAKEMGATALFGEKYGEMVRVVIIDGVSKELCGGTHAACTAELGFFKIISESGIGSGIRRIEAVTGREAFKYVNNNEKLLDRAAEILKTQPAELTAKLESLVGRVKELEHELTAMQAQIAKNEVQELMNQIETISGIKVVTGQVSAPDMDSLRSVADLIRDRLDCGVVALGAINNGKVNFVVMATRNAVAQNIHAGNIVKNIAKIAEGSGGGRPDMAQAGGKNPDKIADALKAVTEIVRSQVK